MKVGSLVEMVTNIGPKSTKTALIYNLNLPSIGVPYTVRGIVTRMGVAALLLEEIVNPEMDTVEGFMEVGFGIALFRELQLPMDVSALAEELLNEPQPC